MQSSSPFVADARIAQVTSGTGWILFALGLMVLVGWAFHVSTLVSIIPGLAAMKANAAAAFLLAGAALLRRNARDLPFYSLGVLLIGTATLTEYLSNSDFGIDQLLFRDPWSAIDPGRMSQITSVGLLLLGPALLLMKARSPWRRRTSRALGLLVGSIGFIVLLGYSYETHALYQVSSHTSVALHTALAFVIAAIGVQCANPVEGMVRQIHADSAGGAMLRQLLPAALLIPFLLGFTAWIGQQYLGWELGFSMALVIAATTFCLVILMQRNARHLEEKDLAQRESEERYRHLVESSNDWVWEVDAEGAYTYVSPRCREILGYEPAELIGKTPFHIMPPEESRRVAAVFEVLAAERKTFRGLENINLHKDGHLVVLETNGVPVIDKQGRFCGYRGMDRDVTARRQAEKSLRESEERFRRVVENIGDALFVDDAEGRIVFANDRFLKLFGFRREELQNVALEDYVAPEYRAELRARHDRRIRGEAMPSQFEYEGIRRDGTRNWLEVDVVPIKDQAGNLVGTQSALRDITERKQAEHALQESEERFRLVANTAPVMIWMSGTDKLCNYFNQPWLEFTGRPLEAELGNGWAEGVHAEDLKGCLDIYTRAFDQRESFQMQYRLRRNDGEYRWLLDIGVPRLNPNGSFAGYIGSCVDITDRKLAEEALADMGRRLIAAHEEERTWIARELHDDINQRIALLAIELEQLKQNIPESAVGSHDHIGQIGQSLSDLGKDIQALSHRLHSSKIEYLGIAAAASSFCKELSEQQRVEIDFSHAGIPHSVPKEISLCLFRVLQEALQNAVKHSGVRHFRVELSGNAGEIQLTVSDLGVGFDQQDVVKRHGLGLISMRERLHLVNGEFSIKSDPGRGTTLNARVPLRAESTVPDLAHRARTA